MEAGYKFALPLQPNSILKNIDFLLHCTLTISSLQLLMLTRTANSETFPNWVLYRNFGKSEDLFGPTLVPFSFLLILQECTLEELRVGLNSVAQPFNRMRIEVNYRKTTNVIRLVWTIINSSQIAYHLMRKVNASRSIAWEFDQVKGQRSSQANSCYLKLLGVFATVARR